MTGAGNHGLVTAGPRDAEVVQGAVNRVDFPRAGVRHADTRSVVMNFSVDAGARPRSYANANGPNGRDRDDQRRKEPSTDGPWHPTTCPPQRRSIHWRPEYSGQSRARSSAADWVLR